jgi:glycerate kinase
VASEASEETATPRRVLVCPQEFKGSLTAAEAAAALARGVHDALPDAEVRELPMADGGPGTVAIVAAASNAALRTVEVTGPLGTPIAAQYAIDAASEVATLEASAAAGLLLVAEAERNPLRASTRGVGELVAAAIADGAHEVVLGVGGTGTNDGGAGAAQALGLRLLDANGDELPPGPLHLIRLARIERGEAPRGLEATRLRIAVDVTNPLLGEHGATPVYGPQKGVTDWQAPAFEECLTRFAELIERDLDIDVRALDGAGAGGGLPSGLLAAVRAAGGDCAIESGAALVAERIGLREAIEWSDLVLTGEGSMDTQSAYGKTTAHVASLARDAGRRCVAVAGSVEGTRPGIASAVALLDMARDLDDAMARAAELAAACARRVVAI